MESWALGKVFNDLIMTKMGLKMTINKLIDYYHLKIYIWKHAFVICIINFNKLDYNPRNARLFFIVFL